MITPQVIPQYIAGYYTKAGTIFNVQNEKYLYELFNQYNTTYTIDSIIELEAIFPILYEIFKDENFSYAELSYFLNLKEECMSLIIHIYNENPPGYTIELPLNEDEQTVLWLLYVAYRKRIAEQKKHEDNEDEDKK